METDKKVKNSDIDMIDGRPLDQKSAADIGQFGQTGPNGLNNTQGSTETDVLFQKHYSKELKVNEDEIPFVLAEFTENAMRYIK